VNATKTAATRPAIARYAENGERRGRAAMNPAYRGDGHGSDRLSCQTGYVEAVAFAAFAKRLFFH
jgi:hypothetical protein